MSDDTRLYAVYREFSDQPTVRDAVAHALGAGGNGDMRSRFVQASPETLAYVEHILAVTVETWAASHEVLLEDIDGVRAELKRLRNRDQAQQLHRAEKVGAAGELQLITASTVKIDRPTWVWEGRIPVAGVTLMAGREGAGKTALACWASAQLTCGKLDGTWQGQPTDVVYVGHEDDRETVLGPRLHAAGADLDRFHFVNLAARPFTVGNDVAELATKLAGRQVGLLVIDPLDSHLGAEVDSHKKAEVQAAIAHLANFAQGLRCGVLGLGHLNKAPIRDLLAKVIGSVGFTTSVRSVLAVGEHPDDPRDAVMVLAKTNITDRPSVPALRFRVTKGFVNHPDGGVAIDTAHVQILGEESGLNPNDLLGHDRGTDSDDPASADADSALTQVLADGSMWVKDVMEAMAEAGFTKDQARRAKSRVAHAFRVGKVGDPEQGWRWGLRHAPSPSEEA